jgi:hypothetical protein
MRHLKGTQQNVDDPHFYCTCIGADLSNFLGVPVTKDLGYSYAPCQRVGKRRRCVSDEVPTNNGSFKQSCNLRVRPLCGHCRQRPESLSQSGSQEIEILKGSMNQLDKARILLRAAPSCSNVRPELGWGFDGRIQAGLIGCPGRTSDCSGHHLEPTTTPIVVVLGSLWFIGSPSLFY